MNLNKIIKTTLNELFLLQPSLEMKKLECKYSGYKPYYVHNGNNPNPGSNQIISALYVVEPMQNDMVNLGWEWADDRVMYTLKLNGQIPKIPEENKDKSSNAWVKVVNMGPIVLNDYINTNKNPKVVLMFSNQDQKNRIYKSAQFIDICQHYVGNKYEIKAVDHGLLFISKEEYDEDLMNDGESFINQFFK